MAEVEVIEADIGVSSAAEEEGGAAFLQVFSFWSSETFPILMGSVNMTSGDFRLTWFIRGNQRIHIHE